MMAAMVELFCDSFEQVPRRIVLDIDDTEDRVHGGQQLALFHAHYDSRCFLPIHIYEATTGKPVAVILRPGKTPDGAEVALVLRHVVGPSAPAGPRSTSWSAATAITPGPRRMDLAASATASATSSASPATRCCSARSRHLAEDAALGRVAGEADKVRRYGEFRYAAKTWNVERQVIARVEASAQGSDSRFIVTNLTGTPRWLYEEVYCARGQAENLIKAHKLHLASDRTSCTQGDRQPVPAADPHRRLLAAAHPARPGAQDLVLARRPVRHASASPDQGGRPRHRDGHPDQGRPAVRLPLPGQPRPARRPRRQAAALTAGAACPARARVPQPQAPTPRHPRHRSAGPAQSKPPETKPDE